MCDDIRYAENGSVRLAYQTHGDLSTGEPLLLIMGLDFQMVWWPEDFIDGLVRAGFAVTCFDNRDTGLSTHFAPVARPNPWKALLGQTEPAYTSRDMLDDALAVMDAVGWRSAHVLGASMGAALAQGLAMENPDRVRSLTSCVGTPADTGVLTTLTYIHWGTLLKLARTNAHTEQEQIAALAAVWRTMSGPHHPVDEEWIQRAARTSHARSPRDNSTTQRQLAAGRAHHFGRIEAITVPTLVIAGRADPLIRWQAGRDTARRITGSRFVCYDGLGHAMSPALIPTLVEEISRVAGLTAGSV